MRFGSPICLHMFAKSRPDARACSLALVVAAAALAGCGPAGQVSNAPLVNAPAPTPSLTAGSDANANFPPAQSVAGSTSVIPAPLPVPVPSAATGLPPDSVAMASPAPSESNPHASAGLARNGGAPLAQQPYNAAYPPPSTYAPAPLAAPPTIVQQRSAPVAHNHAGSIERIEPIRNRPQGSGAGAVLGGVLGAVVGNQFGHGGGRAAMTGVGAVGGALAGNNVERNYREGVVGYRVEIRLDNGSIRTFQRSQIGNLRVGDRVLLEARSFHRA